MPDSKWTYEQWRDAIAVDPELLKRLVDRMIAFSEEATEANLLATKYMALADEYMRRVRFAQAYIAAEVAQARVAREVDAIEEEGPEFEDAFIRLMAAKRKTLECHHEMMVALRTMAKEQIDG